MAGMGGMGCGMGLSLEQPQASGFAMLNRAAATDQAEDLRIALTSRTHPSNIIPVGLVAGCNIRLVDPTPFPRRGQEISGGQGRPGGITGGSVQSGSEWTLIEFILPRRGRVTQGLNPIPLK